MAEAVSETGQPGADSPSASHRSAQEAKNLREADAFRSREDFARTVHDYYPRLIGFFRRREVRDADLLDVVQETLLQAYLSFPTFSHRSKFSSWLFAIAVRTEARWRRKAPEKLFVATPVVDVRPPLDSQEEQLASMLASERRQQLRAAVAELPVKMRRCMQLRLYQERSYNEISEILKIRLGTVKAHINQGSQKLHQRFAQSDDTRGSEQA